MRQLLDRSGSDRGLTLLDLLESDSVFTMDFVVPDDVIPEQPPWLGLYFSRDRHNALEGDYPTFIDNRLDCEDIRFDGKQYDVTSFINGVCRVDAPQKRILFEPYARSGKWREMVQANGGEDLLYPGYLVDVIFELVEEGGYELLQVTDISRHPLISTNKNLNTINYAKMKFSEITGKHRSEAFQVEGPRTIKDLCEGNFLEPTAMLLNKEDYVKKVSPYW